MDPAPSDLAEGTVTWIADKLNAIGDPEFRAIYRVLRHWHGVSGSGRLRRCRPLLLIRRPDPRWSPSARPRDTRLSCLWPARDQRVDEHGGRHRFPRDIILLAVRYCLQLGAAAERIAGILADRGVDVSGRTILRWVQKFGPTLSDEIRRYRKSVSTTWLVDETYVKILGKWHYLYRGVDEDGQVLDCWLVTDA